MTAVGRVCQDVVMEKEQREYETWKLAERLYNKWRPNLMHETWVGLRMPAKLRWFGLAELAWAEVEALTA